MKWLLSVSLLLTGLVVGQSAQAIGKLSVELRTANQDSQEKLGVNSGVVEVELKNTGDQAIEVDLDRIPVTMKNGKLVSGVFTVVGPDGQEAQYVGMFVEYGDENDLRTEVIPPGKTVVKQANILRSYRLTPGQMYTVSMRNPVRYLDRPRALTPSASSSDLRSLLKTEEVAPIQITVDAKSVDESAKNVSMIPAAAPAAACTSDQSTKFNEAKTKAQQIAVEASGFMTAQFSQVVENGIVYELFANPPRFVTWFGHHPDKYKAMDGPGAVDATLRTAINAQPPRIYNMTLSCQCDGTGIDPKKTMAYVDPATTYVVHACDLFWSAPLIPTTRDENSRAGTLVHEAVHFIDQSWGALAWGRTAQATTLALPTRTH